MKGNIKSQVIFVMTQVLVILISVFAEGCDAKVTTLNLGRLLKELQGQCVKLTSYKLLKEL
jgi:hypothetical protein